MSEPAAPKTTNLLQGTLALLILRALSLEPLHGLGISRRIEQITRGTFQVKPGSLFPALHRMEEAGWLAPSWGESENAFRTFAACPLPEGRTFRSPSWATIE